jgi:hypothetical protein
VSTELLKKIAGFFSTDHCHLPEMGGISWAGKRVSMIEIISCDYRDLASYASFCRDIYRDNPFFRDSGLTGVLRMISSGREPFFRHAEITPVMVGSNGEILAVCLLIANREQPDMLQLSYFEAREGCQSAVDLLMTAAATLCKKKGLPRIVIGLDNVLGMLADNFDCVPCYGTRYNPAYYPDYFDKYGAREHILASYLIDPNRCITAREQKILNRIGKKFTCRVANWRHLGRETAIYTYLKNRCFAGHSFFAPGSVEINYRMFSSYQSLISGQNLLILERDGLPAGYLLWFPDYNQLLAPGDVMDQDTCRRYRMRGRKIDKFTVAEIVVLPEYQGSGAILVLLDQCLQLTKASYDRCETGWIFDDNIKSKGFGIRWADSEYRHYKIFEVFV